MPAPEFLDTNVLVHAYDPSVSRKQRVAQALVRRAFAGDILVSTQVLAEFAVTLLHKRSVPRVRRMRRQCRMRWLPFASWS